MSITQHTTIGKARQYLINVVKRDHHLTGVKRWVLMDGQATDINPPNDKQTPFVKFTSYPEKSEWYCNDGGVPVRHCPWILRIEMVTKLPSDYESIDLWERIRDALFPTDPAVAATLRAGMLAVGISGIAPVMEGWGNTGKAATLVSRPDATTQTIHAEALIRVSMYLQTEA